MKLLKRNLSAKGLESPYATSDDFRRIFTEYKDDLHGFSFLLTGDQETAELCFVAGLEESVRADGVFREWARSWAKRTIIQNAIHALRPRPPVEDPSLVASMIQDHSKLPQIFDVRTDVNSVLALDDFGRIVFVASVLEGYSDRRCALLLNCTDQEIRTARTQAIVRITNSNLTPVVSKAQMPLTYG